MVLTIKIRLNVIIECPSYTLSSLRLCLIHFCFIIFQVWKMAPWKLGKILYSSFSRYSYFTSKMGGEISPLQLGTGKYAILLKKFYKLLWELDQDFYPSSEKCGMKTSSVHFYVHKELRTASRKWNFCNSIILDTQYQNYQHVKISIQSSSDSFNIKKELELVSRSHCMTNFPIKFSFVILHQLDKFNYQNVYFWSYSVECMFPPKAFYDAMKVKILELISLITKSFWSEIKSCSFKSARFYCTEILDREAKYEKGDKRDGR